MEEDKTIDPTPESTVAPEETADTGTEAETPSEPTEEIADGGIAPAIASVEEA